MPSRTLPYSDPLSAGRRPYLWLSVSGVAGRALRVLGLIDSGADQTLLPVGFMGALGYAVTDLELVEIATAGARTRAFSAKRPRAAHVLGLPTVAIALRPVFNPSCPFTLWGRADFMVAFDVTISERSQTFTLAW